MNADAYLHAAHQRMAAGGYQAGPVQLRGGTALIGYRSDFRLRWMATKLHLFVAVLPVAAVTPDYLRAFAEDVLGHAKATKGGARGLQSGVGAVAALVSDRVEDAAIGYAQRELVRGFAAFAWPAVVDLGRGQVFSQTGRPKIGAVYNGWMREQIAVTLPPPA